MSGSFVIAQLLSASAMAAAACYVPRATCHMRHLARRNNNICQAANKLTAIKAVISWQRPRILPDCQLRSRSNTLTHTPTAKWQLNSPKNQAAKQTLSFFWRGICWLVLLLQHVPCVAFTIIVTYMSPTSSAWPTRRKCTNCCDLF